MAMMMMMRMMAIMMMDNDASKQTGFAGSAEQAKLGIPIVHKN